MPGSARIWGRCPEAQGCRRDRPRVDSLLACSPARATKPQPVSSDTLEVIRAMRIDMNKVVVERERGGSTRRNRKWGKRLPFVPDADYEDQPKFVSSGRRRQYGSDCKWFTDVLGPLEGFLHTQSRAALGQGAQRIAPRSRRSQGDRATHFPSPEQMGETDS